MPNKRKNAKHPVIVHGLYAHMEKWKIDGRTKPGKAKRASEEFLAGLFPKGPGWFDLWLIDRIIFKTLQIGRFEAMCWRNPSIADNEGRMRRYDTLNDSCKGDMKDLEARLEKQGVNKPPDLQTYLASLKEAGQAMAGEGGCGHDCRCRGEGGEGG